MAKNKPEGESFLFSHALLIYIKNEYIVHLNLDKKTAKSLPAVPLNRFYHREDK